MRLTSSKLKPKGERALVLKAWATITNKQEILAIRFFIKIMPFNLPKNINPYFQCQYPVTITLKIYLNSNLSSNGNNKNNLKPSNNHATRFFFIFYISSLHTQLSAKSHYHNT